MQYADNSADLANLALILVLGAALSGMWLGALESALACALAVMAFNWQFVPPRGTFSIDLSHHALLLIVMWSVGSVVAWLTSRQRALAEIAQGMATQTTQLHRFSEQLRGMPPAQVAQALSLALQEVSSAPSLVMAHLGWPGNVTESHAGSATPEEWALARECLRRGAASQASSQERENQHIHALPLRGSNRCIGAAVLRLNEEKALCANCLTTAQALCDQAALHLERTETEAQTLRAQQDAQSHRIRNTLLAAISHDYRTPLATILGAASSLLTQSDRLTPAQAKACAQTIVDEVHLLRGMTDNTLELSRLDTAGVQIHQDWESLEELVGSALARAKVRHPSLRLHPRLEKGLPLLRCDASLVVQLLDNLVENAIKYGPQGHPIEIIARQVDSQILLTVADRGPGIPAALRERVFEAFERGPSLATVSGPARGAGLGLALCRAIMQAHGGSIQPRPRQRGGTSMECRFPVQTQPARPGLEGDMP